MARKRKRKKKGKYISQSTINAIKKLLNGHRLVHGYKIVKRKRKKR